MTKCFCINCEKDFIEEESNAYETTVYCSIDCESSDN